MRYYEDKYPEVDDLVMVTVKQIADMGAYVKLVRAHPFFPIPFAMLVLRLGSGEPDELTTRGDPFRAKLTFVLSLLSSLPAPLLCLLYSLAHCDVQLEYENVEGMILLSELSRRRIRSIQKLIRVGRNEVVVVLRVDKEKGQYSSQYSARFLHWRCGTVSCCPQGGGTLRPLRGQEAEGGAGRRARRRR